MACNLCQTCKLHNTGGKDKTEQVGVGAYLLLALDNLRPGPVCAPAPQYSSTFQIHNYVQKTVHNTQIDANFNNQNHAHIRAADLSVSDSESMCFWCTASAHHNHSCKLPISTCNANAYYAGNERLLWHTR